MNDVSPSRRSSVAMRNVKNVDKDHHHLVLYSRSSKPNLPLVSIGDKKRLLARSKSKLELLKKAVPNLEKDVKSMRKSSSMSSMSSMSPLAAASKKNTGAKKTKKKRHRKKKKSFLSHIFK